MIATLSLVNTDTCSCLKKRVFGQNKNVLHVTGSVSHVTHVVVTAALSCLRRLLALHPLNPDYWLRCARLHRQVAFLAASDPSAADGDVMAETDATAAPDWTRKVDAIATGAKLESRTACDALTGLENNVNRISRFQCNFDEKRRPKGGGGKLLRISLYNPEYPCLTCAKEVCARCSVYKNRELLTCDENEACSDGCPGQNLAPEVWVWETGSDAWCKQEVTSQGTGSTHVVHGCTRLLQTPHDTHEPWSAEQDPLLQEYICDTDVFRDRLDNITLDARNVAASDADAAGNVSNSRVTDARRQENRAWSPSGDVTRVGARHDGARERCSGGQEGSDGFDRRLSGGEEEGSGGGADPRGRDINLRRAEAVSLFRARCVNQQTSHCSRQNWTLGAICVAHAALEFNT